MCVGGGGAPPPPPPPAPMPAPKPVADEIIVPGDSKRKRALAGAAGRGGNILTGGGGDLGQPNIGKTLLGA
jgi:hypothetical protein